MNLKLHNLTYTTRAGAWVRLGKNTLGVVGALLTWCEQCAAPPRGRSPSLVQCARRPCPYTIEHQLGTVRMAIIHRFGRSRMRSKSAEMCADGARAPKADGSQSLDLQRDALRAAGIDDAAHRDHDVASGVRYDRPGLDSWLRALRTGDGLVSGSGTG